MNQSHDPNETADVPPAPADSLDAGLAAGFGRPAVAPRSSLGDLRPVLLKVAEGESAHVVKPKSDAMPSPDQTGDRYQLQGEIARGGMGAVLRGHDVDLGRDLAVKILLEKYANRPEVARRFIEEAQIGGQLQHPGVVPVYDIGRFGERPFFTMKLVKGQTLAHLLAERTDHTQDRPRFLAIALQVCQTLAYAHAKGVIHRDLKPANVMVGAFGEVQVMDWGLAKVLAEGGVADEERASRTQQRDDVTTIRTARSTGSTGSFGTDTEAGSLLGTPAYMPPEQANGDIAHLDRRADVFGLGAILCEVLTGKAPYVGRSLEEVRRKACNGDLADALGRLDSCGADTELIAMTKSCLSPEAIDRPKDAQAVADGLSAYLNGVQERLHQAELAEAEARAIACEEVKRRRLTLALAATILLALALGGGSWLFVKHESDARIARTTHDVNDALNQATALREQAKAATIGGAALFAQAREHVQRAVALVENGPAEEALKDQVQRLKTELDEEDKDRALVAALDEARLAQAETVAAENRPATERAVPKFREAFRAYGLPAGEGEPAAAANRIRQRPAAVRDAIVAALDEWDHLTGNPILEIAEPHRNWLRAVLEAAEPDDAWSRQVREALRDTNQAKGQATLEALAKSAKVEELPARALTSLAAQLPLPQSVDLLRRAQRQYPADFWINHELGFRLRFVTPPKFDEAVRFSTAAVALRPDSPGTRFNLGRALYDHGRMDDAISSYQKALELEPKYAAVHGELGRALMYAGQLDAAITSFKKSIELDPTFALAHNNLGAALCDIKDDYDAAIASFRTAIELEPTFALAHTNLGHALMNKGWLDEAIASFQKAIELEPNFALAHINLGHALMNKGQLDEAITCYRKAIELDEKEVQTYGYVGQTPIIDSGGGGRADTYARLGEALEQKRQLDEAITCYRKAIELDPKLETAHNNLGFELERRGQLDEAIASFRNLVELSPKDAHTHYNLGNLLLKKGQLDEAVASFKKAIELDPKCAEAHCNLANTLQQLGRFAESLAAHQRGHELGTKQPGWRYPSAQWVREAESLAAMETKLTAFIEDEFQPKDTAERLDLIGVCRGKKLWATAARLSADAFAADPLLADDLKGGRRYNAACYAALAAAGQGEDAAKLDDQELSRLRKQALDWLRADLALHTTQLESGNPADRMAAQEALRHWQQDSDLAGLRDATVLARLREEDRAACERLWADVTMLLK